MKKELHHQPEMKWEMIKEPKYIEIAVKDKTIKLEIIPDFEDGFDVYQIIN